MAEGSGKVQQDKRNTGMNAGAHERQQDNRNTGMVAGAMEKVNKITLNSGYDHRCTGRVNSSCFPIVNMYRYKTIIKAKFRANYQIFKKYDRTETWKF